MTAEHHHRNVDERTAMLAGFVFTVLSEDDATRPLHAV